MDEQKNAKFEFEGENKKKLSIILKEYDDKRSALIPVLHLAQAQVGYLPNYVLKEIASILNLTLKNVIEVVSFYDSLYTQPTGNYIVQVCTNISCSLEGSRDILSSIKEKNNLEQNHLSQDKGIFLKSHQCFGTCTNAPCMKVNNVYYGELDVVSANRIIEDLR